MTIDIKKSALNVGGLMKKMKCSIKYDKTSETLICRRIAMISLAVNEYCDFA